MHNDWVMRKSQFRVLYGVFLMRVIDLELLSADADPSKLIGQFVTTFSSISLLFTLPVILGGGFAVVKRGIGFHTEGTEVGAQRTRRRKRSEKRGKTRILETALRQGSGQAGCGTRLAPPLELR